MAGYGTNTGFRDYAALAGYDIPAETTDAQIAGARQRGSLAVDRIEPQLGGSRTGGFQQERAAPRVGWETRWGETIPSDVIPEAFINASYELAWIELTEPGSLSPVVTPSSAVKREKVGSLEVEYQATSSTSAEDVAAFATPIVTIVNGMLWPFTVPVLPAILVV